MNCMSLGNKHCFIVIVIVIVKLRLTFGYSFFIFSGFVFVRNIAENGWMKSHEILKIETMNN